jgi:hypothetical protein
MVVPRAFSFCDFFVSLRVRGVGASIVADVNKKYNDTLNFFKVS